MSVPPPQCRRYLGPRSPRDREDPQQKEPDIFKEISKKKVFKKGFFFQFFFLIFQLKYIGHRLIFG